MNIQSADPMTNGRSGPTAAEPVASLRHAISEAPVALVTGASRGLGEAIARRLAARGMRVFGTSRNPGKAAPDWGEMIALDVREAASVEHAVAGIIGKAGRIDILVNNAGYPLTGAVEELSPEDLLAQLDTNLIGPLRLIRAVLPHMRSRRAGKIVNISSAAASVPLPCYGGYGASKAALERLSRSLRSEVRGEGISVGCIVPSSHRTAVVHVLPQRTIPAYDAMRTGMLAAINESVAKGDDPDQVARAVLRFVTTARAPATIRVGHDSRAFGLLLRLLPSGAIDWLVRKRFGLA